MAPGGTIYALTVDMDEMKFPWSIQGSLPATRGSQREMLQFAAHHHVKPIVMTFSVSHKAIEKAMTTLGEGKMRYRAILVNDLNPME